MPIVSTDLKIRLSVPSAETGGASEQADPDASLGKWCSTTEVEDATLNNLWDDVSGDENAAEESEYRCIFVHNAHETLTGLNGVVWISAEVANGANCKIGLDTTDASAYDADEAEQALEVEDEDTAPDGVSFSAPTSKATGLSVGDLTAGYVKGVWVKRTTTNSTALNNDGVTIKYECETEA